MRPRRVAFLLLPALLIASVPASAHEHVCVKGATFTEAGHGSSCETTDDLHFIVGWTAEPPFTMQKNGLDLGVEFASNSTPVANLTTLNAQYEFGGKTFPLELRGQFRRDGRYTGDIMPTRPGEYTVRVWGTVHGLAVNFSVHPETVSESKDIAFPEPPPDTATLQQRVTALEQRVGSMDAMMKNDTGSMRNGQVTPSPPTQSTPGVEPVLALAVLAGLGWATRRRTR